MLKNIKFCSESLTHKITHTKHFNSHLSHNQLTFRNIFASNVYFSFNPFNKLSKSP